MKISVLGLGKLGACYAAFYADRGFTVVGVDSDARKVEAINAGLPSVSEPGLAELISKNKKRLSATLRVEEAVLNSDVTFIIVPTPSEKDGSFSVDYVTSACTEIGKALRKKNSYHLISLVSTVLPGDSRDRIISSLEKSSKKKCGKDFGYTYNPSLIAIGDIIYNLTNPDFLFLGAYDVRSDETLTKIYKKLYPDRAPEHMSIESVEIAKISLNSYITMKITFANLLGKLCEQIPHADVDDITTALGKDKRIGSAYFKSGLGFGGPCFPRDNYAFANMARKRGVRTTLALATHQTNVEIAKDMASYVIAEAKRLKTKKIGFLGVSYKPNTTLTEDSQACMIAKQLLKNGYAVTVYEPLGNEEAKRALGKKAICVDTLEELADTADVLFVSNKDTFFEGLPLIVKVRKTPKSIVDPWGMYSNADLGSTHTYKPIGRKVSKRA